MIDPNLNIAEVEFPHSTRARVWKRYWSILFWDQAATFGIVAFLLMGLSWVLLALLTSVSSPKLLALGVGGMAGLLACCCLGAKEIEYFTRLRSDLSGCKGERLSAVVKHAVAVDLPGGIPAVALDCGSHTLVLLRRWWKNSRRTDIEWSPADSRKHFPATRFSLVRLPRSGLVISVEVCGERLKVQKGSPTEPELSLAVPRYMDAYSTEKALPDIPIVEFPQS